MIFMSDSSQDTWSFICPEGKEYQIGERIPMHRAAEGVIFGEEVVRVPCPGFKGMRICKDEDGAPHTLEEGLDRGCCVKIEPLEADPNVFFVGPESQAWRWEYARVEIMRSKAFHIHEQKSIMAVFASLEDMGIEDDSADQEEEEE